MVMESGGSEEDQVTEGGKSAEEEENPQDISTKIRPVKRLCRTGCCEQNRSPYDQQQHQLQQWQQQYMQQQQHLQQVEEGMNSDNECLVACPVVLRQLCTQTRASGMRGNRGSRNTSVCLSSVSKGLAVRPYWRRCLCSSDLLPSVTERELLPLLALTPPHRFIVIIVTNSSESTRSVVVGGESLMQAMYVSQNLPGLRPCLQSPSEPSLAFVKYDLAKPKSKRKERKTGPSTILNKGNVKVGMVLIYQKTKMLYAGFPLASYGCMKQEFLHFISKHTRYQFHLRMPPLPNAASSAGDSSDILSSAEKTTGI